ncbi:lipid A-modifier LpxR family protein [Zhouia sp. PK063]|uniref:lipid A-modifier LpxR family protein n=1 Tax=Zhouia sp. PK063 TaxID=3373602 RepID=UPI0037BA02B7
MRFKILTSLLLLCGCSVRSQELRHLFSFQIDNDLFVPQDHDNYYTSGLFFHYKFNTDRFLFLKNNVVTQFSFGQQMFTPNQPKYSNTYQYDRPFAGWLSLKASGLKVANNYAVSVAVELGFTGDYSFGKQLHRSFHETFHFEEVPTWAGQIPTELMVNVSSSYQQKIFNWAYTTINTTLGTKDVFADGGITFIYNDNFKNYLKLPLSRNYISGFTTLKYRWVGYDALIEGSIWNNNATVTRKPEHHLFLVSTGANFQLKKWLVQFSYNYISKRTAYAKYHIYGSLNICYLF